MTMKPNRHPADELADVRAEIRRLQEREEALRAHLLEHPEDRIGDDYTVSISSQSRKHVDQAAGRRDRRVAAGALHQLHHIASRPPAGE
jgi:hypothetical protein